MSMNAGGVGGVTGSPYNAYGTTGTPARRERVTPANASDPATVNRLWAETDQRTQALRDMVEKLIGTSRKEGQAYWAIRADGGAYGIEVDEETRLKAQEMIGEDGYYGVAKTSERILDFAKALAGAGADAETIEEMRAGAQEGFDMVAKLFGGWDKVPEITKQTYEAVMKGFDDWKAGSGAPAPEPAVTDTAQ